MDSKKKKRFIYWLHTKSDVNITLARNVGTKPARLKSHCSICAQGSFVCITSQQKAFFFSLIKLSHHQPWICQNLIKLTEHAFYGRFSIKPAQTDWLTLFLRAVDALLAWYIINNKQRAVFFWLQPAAHKTYCLGKQKFDINGSIFGWLVQISCFTTFGVVYELCTSIQPVIPHQAEQAVSVLWQTRIECLKPD